jgi:hypothetical protein
VFEGRRGDDDPIESLHYWLIPQSQAWFWTERWQEMEREADADYAAGRFRSFSRPEDFRADLERITAEEHPAGAALSAG